MKAHYIFMTCLALAVITTGCNEKAIYPGDNDYNQASIEDIPTMPDPMPAVPDPEGAIIPEGTITVKDALDTCSSLSSGQSTQDTLYIKGWVCSIVVDKTAESFSKGYNNAYFYLGQNPSSARKYGIYGYQVYGKGGKKLGTSDAVQVGDFVVMRAKLTNYNGIYETVQGTASIEYSTNALWDPQRDTTNITPDPIGVTIPEGTLNVYQARDSCEKLASGASTVYSHYVKGYVCKIHADNTTALAKNKARFMIAATNDHTADSFDFQAYEVFHNNPSITSADQVKVGDYVILYGKLTNYNGTYETASGGSIYYSSNPLLQSSK